MKLNVVPVANYHCILGENPLWNERDGRVYWEDIETGRLFRLSHATLEHECFYQGPRVGGFTFQDDGTLLLFEDDRITVLDPETGKRRVLAEGVDSGMERFNDVIADPEGRVFAGTIGKTDESGGLFRVDHDGTVTAVWRGTKIANGMGFTRDLSRFYWTCTTSGTIFVADYDRERGELSNRRPFYVTPESEGSPDGCAVDAEDGLWTARWGGAAVMHVSADGQLRDRIDFPVSNVTSAAFGGPELDTLYVTTASGTPGSETPEGTVYRVQVPARGRPEFRSRIRL